MCIPGYRARGSRAVFVNLWLAEDPVFGKTKRQVDDDFDAHLPARVCNLATGLADWETVLSVKARVLLTITPVTAVRVASGG